MKLTKTTVFTILAVVGAAVGVLGTALGLSIDLAAVMAGVAGILVYVFGALKTDLARIDQPLVWKDPKVWIAVAEAVLTALATAGVALPAPLTNEIVITLLTIILGFLFKPAEVVVALRAQRARGKAIG